MGGDINPAEPVCEYPETCLQGAAVLEKVNLFQFYIYIFFFILLVNLKIMAYYKLLHYYERLCPQIAKYLQVCREFG